MLIRVLRIGVLVGPAVFAALLVSCSCRDDKPRRIGGVEPDPSECRYETRELVCTVTSYEVSAAGDNARLQVAVQTDRDPVTGVAPGAPFRSIWTGPKGSAEAALDGIGAQSGPLPCEVDVLVAGKCVPTQFRFTGLELPEGFELGAR